MTSAVNDMNSPTNQHDDSRRVLNTHQEHWYVAIVNARHEKSVAERLQESGIESYVASQKELRVWKNGRRKIIDRVVIPSIVFIKCTERQRREIVTLPFIFRFMVNRSAETGGLNKPAATIPDNEIEQLKFMLGQATTPVSFDPSIFSVHDNVRVIRGHLKGMVGEVVRKSDGSHTLTILISMLGGASVIIDPLDLEKID